MQPRGGKFCYHGEKREISGFGTSRGRVEEALVQRPRSIIIFTLCTIHSLLPTLTLHYKLYTIHFNSHLCHLCDQSSQLNQLQVYSYRVYIFIILHNIHPFCPSPYVLSGSPLLKKQYVSLSSLVIY